MAPTTYGYMLCGQWPGVAPNGATMFVKCAKSLPPARYVVIIGYTTEPLNICELEVYRATGNSLVLIHLSPTHDFIIPSIPI